MASSVHVHRHVAGRRHGVCGLCAKCNCVRRNGIIICPLNRTAGMDHQFRLNKTHDGNCVMPACVGHDLADSCRDGIRMMMAGRQVRCGQQVAGLLGCLLVVEGLLVRKWYRCIQDMDRARHICMHQANQFVVAGGWKLHRECSTGDHRWSTYAGSSIKCRTACGKSRAADRERQANLSVCQKGNGVNFIDFESPNDAVSSINPDFIKQKRERLMSLIPALSAYRPFPLITKSWSKCQQGKKYRQS